MTYKEYKNESYNLYTIRTDKFKTCHMEIIFYNKLEKEKITEINMLTDILSHSSSKYPKRKFVVEKLEDLYSANFYGVTSRIGNIKNVDFVYNFINPEYTDKNYLKEVIKFPFDMIFNPNIKNDEFDLRSFKIIRSRILADIESVKESPVRFSLKRALNVMDENHPASWSMIGNVNDLEKITPSSLVKTYNEFLNNWQCDIYLIGNLNMDKINIMINESFRNNIIKNNSYDLFVKLSDRNKTKDVIEYDKFEQASLFLITNTETFTQYERNYVMPVFNDIFGTGSLNTKLYQNLREKNSLCYVINCMYQKFDQIAIIYVGIDAKNKQKAVNLVKKSLKEMVNGEFTEDDVLSSIKSIKNNLKISLDNPSSLIDNYFFHNLANSPFLSERINKINDVTRDDVIGLAKKLKINTIYMMAPGGKDERN